MENLKTIIFNAASKSSFEAVVKAITLELKKHHCIKITSKGAVVQGGGFSFLDFSTVRVEFIYYGFVGSLQLSTNGGQFYATISSMHEVLMSNETCMTVDSMIKKFDKILSK